MKCLTGRQLLEILQTLSDDELDREVWIPSSYGLTEAAGAGVPYPGTGIHIVDGLDLDVIGE